jgi:hypothetical protein
VAVSFLGLDIGTLLLSVVDFFKYAFGFLASRSSINNDDEDEDEEINVSLIAGVLF